MNYTELYMASYPVGIKPDLIEKAENFIKKICEIVRLNK